MDSCHVLSAPDEQFLTECCVGFIDDNDADMVGLRTKRWKANTLKRVPLTPIDSKLTSVQADVSNARDARIVELEHTIVVSKREHADVLQARDARIAELELTISDLDSALLRARNVTCDLLAEKLTDVTGKLANPKTYRF